MVPKELRLALSLVVLLLPLTGWTFAPGFTAGIHSGWGRISSGSTSQGNGFSLGLTGRFQLMKYLSIRLSPQYRTLSLSREIDASGVLSDSTPGEFRHSMQWVAAGSELSLDTNHLLKHLGPGARWYIDAGMEWLIPLSARQTDGTGSETVIRNVDRPLLLLVGFSAMWPAWEGGALLGALKFFYNVAATSGSQFFGLKFSMLVELDGTVSLKENEGSYGSSDRNDPES